MLCFALINSILLNLLCVWICFYWVSYHLGCLKRGVQDYYVI